jgi:hypothetical protein
LGPSDSDIVRLQLFEGDNISLIAKNFAQRHGLTDIKKRQMEGMLKERMNEVQKL